MLLFTVACLSGFGVLLVAIVRVPYLRVNKLEARRVKRLRDSHLVMLLPNNHFRLRARLIRLSQRRLSQRVPIGQFNVHPTLSAMLVHRLLVSARGNVRFVMVSVAILRDTNVRISLSPIRCFEPFLFVLFRESHFNFYRITSNDDSDFLSIGPKESRDQRAT